MTDAPAGASTAGDAGARMVPFHCPYCGEETLFPREHTEASTGKGTPWECRSCARAFALTFLGLTSTGVTPA